MMSLINQLKQLAGKDELMTLKGEVVYEIIEEMPVIENLSNQSGADLVTYLKTTRERGGVIGFEFDHLIFIMVYTMMDIYATVCYNPNKILHSMQDFFGPLGAKRDIQNIVAFLQNKMELYNSRYN